jgi:hypothetical protein
VPAAETTQRQLIQLQGMVHGYADAAWLGVGIVIAAAVVMTLVNADPATRQPIRSQTRDPKPRRR